MSDSSHNHMKYVKGKNTKIEIMLRKALWQAGIRYRTNDLKLPGKPDIVIRKYKIIIFCDGDFWHGYDIENARIHNNKLFWYEKIQRNIQRDEKITKELEAKDWKVIRFWEHEIKNQLDECVKCVQEAIWDCQLNDIGV